MSTILSGDSQFDHERFTFFNQLQLLQNSSQVYSIAPVRSSQGTYDRLVILGPQDKLKRATIQADVFLHSQRQYMDMAMKTTSSSKQSAAPSGFSIVREVWVDQSLVGLVVGSQGSQIKRIQDQFGVQINIEKTSSQGDKRKITICGKDERDVEDAVEEVNLERVFIPFDNSLIDYVYGYKMKNLDFFHEKSGVVQLDISKNPQTGFEELVAIGTQKSIEDLRTIV